MALACITAARPAGAQETIATDRPGLGFSTSTVRARAFQLEMGTPSFDYSGSQDDPRVDFGAALRYGITDRIEFRTSTSWVVRSPGLAGEDGPTGIAGVRVGAKIGIVAAGPARLALIPELVLPVGEDVFAGVGVAFSMIGVAGIPFGPTGLTMVAGAQHRGDGDADDTTTGVLAAVLSHPLADRLSAYIELGVLPGPGDDAAYAGTGGTWLATQRVQLDVFADFGVTDAASKAVFGAGLAFLVL